MGTNLVRTEEKHPFSPGLVDVCEPDTTVEFDEMTGKQATTLFLSLQNYCGDLFFGTSKALQAMINTRYAKHKNSFFR